MRGKRRIGSATLLPLLIAAFLFTAVRSQSSQTISIPQPSSSPTTQCTNLFGSASAISGNGQNLSGIFTPLSGILGSAVGLSLIALIISFDIIGIGYVISKLVPSANVGNWLSREYWEVAKSAILIMVIFSAMTILSGIGVALSGTPAASGYQNGLSNNLQGMVTGSESYLCTVNSQANVALTNIVPVLIGIGLFQGVTISYAGYPIPTPGLLVFRSGVNFKIFASLLAAVSFLYLGQWLSLFIDFILYLIVPIKVIFSTQVLIFPYLVAVGLGFLIPVGLILRALPFVRGIGGTLIAFGIGFAIVWPGILILFNAPVSAAFCQVMSPNFCNTSIGPSPVPLATVAQSQDYCMSTSGFINNYVGTVVEPICESIYQAFTQWTQNLSNQWNEEIAISFETISSLYPVINLLIQYCSYLIFQLFFLFILDLMIFYALTDNIAKMLGGTIKLQLGRKLKLV